MRFRVFHLLTVMVVAAVLGAAYVVLGLTPFFLILTIVSGAAALTFAELKAAENRRKELQSRAVFPIEEWESACPGVEPRMLTTILDAIGLGLNVEGQYLRPDDTFDGSLGLKGQFVIDDDTDFTVAEHVEEQLGITWNLEWLSVGIAVEEIASQLQGRSSL